jgi:hypothetical protein
MRLGNKPSFLTMLRSIFTKNIECILRVMHEMGQDRRLIFLRVGLMNVGRRRVFAWEVRRKHCMYEENLKMAVVFLSV